MPDTGYTKTTYFRCQAKNSLLRLPFSLNVLTNCTETHSIFQCEMEDFSVRCQDLSYLTLHCSLGLGLHTVYRNPIRQNTSVEAYQAFASLVGRALQAVLHQEAAPVQEDPEAAAGQGQIH